MGIFDKFKFKKAPEKARPAKAEAAKPEPQKPVKKGGSTLAYQILLRPVISEKGTALAGKGRYVFAVARSANKSEIKKSIQKVYDVQVRAVKIVKMPAKARRYGRSRGATSPWKKAIITVNAGEKIPGIIESVG